MSKGTSLIPLRITFKTYWWGWLRQSCHKAPFTDVLFYKLLVKLEGRREERIYCDWTDCGSDEGASKDHP